MRSMLLTWGDESYWAHENLADSLQLGSPPAFQLQSGGVPYFDWLQQPGNEGRSQAFHRAMAEAARALMNAASLEDYPWHMHAAATHTVADVGGGLGSWLAALLEHEPGLRGALVDLPSVVAGAEELWRRERPQLLGRTSFVGADFFSDLLPPADVYFLRFILHDWPDAEATAILRAVRRAVRPGSSAVLLVQDIVMPALQPGVLFTTLDLQMLAIGGGKERTRQEWEALLAAAGFRLARVHRLRALPSLLEAHPA
ncbi:hydroxyneurosporene methyltransferase [Chlorella sorokiniana]|uniref:Hydroxyneurosporene methyltransferase n=1 Tax=Chlorella sorokiniana TaxID=3076 RepID=A0A2P6TY82_CHLSO|nr:hydroxyneurosporene methyltransferase [Chlorella sorokiniana]|eukprot:PRW59016.1 hydroxyneurosporene methyltransferase [Chlorella sorokiniana]